MFSIVDVLEVEQVWLRSMCFLAGVRTIYSSLSSNKEGSSFEHFKTEKKLLDCYGSYTDNYNG